MATIHLYDPNRKTPVKKEFKPKSLFYRKWLIVSGVINVILLIVLLFNK